MNIGDKVRWQSQSQGRATIKEGEIIHILTIGQAPPKELFPSLWKGCGPGNGRNHETYIVKVGNKLYWPRVSALEKRP